jgi:hypothetical protein
MISNLKDMGVGFDPLICARVTIPYNIVSLSVVMDHYLKVPPWLHINPSWD